jgi:DNA-binding NarL/FixJ family response regulator
MFSGMMTKISRTISQVGKRRESANPGRLSKVRPDAKCKIRGSKSMRIFLVDDSAQVLDRLKSILLPLQGVELIGSADDIAAGLDSIRAIRPDVVFLDLRLPSGSGMKLLQMIKEENLGAEVVVLTNYAFPQYRKKCAEAGAFAFLDKSTDFAIVPQIIAALAETKENARGGLPSDDMLSPSEPKIRVG